MLHYISAVARADHVDVPKGKGKGGGKSASMDTIGSLSLGERMVDSNALTEAFGNAKTVRHCVAACITGVCATCARAIARGGKQRTRVTVEALRSAHASGARACATANADTPLRLSRVCH
jgi:hypothetical protein